MPDVVTMDKIVSLARRRGFVFPSSEIYGGLGSVVRLRALRRAAQGERQGALARGDGARARRHRRARLVDHPPPGGLGGLGARDRLRRSARRLPLLQAPLPRRPARPGASAAQKPSKRPGETDKCDLTEPRQFNLMFQTRIGPVEETGQDAYLRPETAQGIFVNFKNVAQIARRKPPFGIAQIGKAFRNEITPGNFIFRTLEFEQMEMEYFVPPAEAEEWFEYWVEERRRVASALRDPGEPPACAPHDAEELSHYSIGHERPRVPLPDRLVGARGDRAPRRLRPHRAHRGVGDEARVGRRRGALHAARGRARAGREPLDARVHGRRVRRGGRGGARADGAAAPSRSRTGEGGRAAADLAERGHGREGTRPVRGASPCGRRGVRRLGPDRPSLPPPGRDRHAVRAHDRRADARGRHGHDPRPRLARAGADPDRRGACVRPGLSSPRTGRRRRPTSGSACRRRSARSRFGRRRGT